MLSGSGRVSYRLGVGKGIDAGSSGCRAPVRGGMRARVAGRAERGGAAGGFRLSVGAAVSVVVAFLTMAAMVALPPVVLAQTPSAELTGLSLNPPIGLW